MPTPPIPRVETERLVLRGFAGDDLEAFAALRSDPEVIRFLPGGELLAPFGRQIAAGRIPRYRDEWGRGYGVWAVVDRSDGAVIGYAGLDRDDGLVEAGEAELLFCLARVAWGRGFGREVAGACLAFGFDRAGLVRITALAARENAASHRVLRAIGMRPVGTDAASGVPVGVYALDRDCWLEKRRSNLCSVT